MRARYCKSKGLRDDGAAVAVPHEHVVLASCLEGDYPVREAFGCVVARSLAVGAAPAKRLDLEAFVVGVQPAPQVPFELAAFLPPRLARVRIGLSEGAMDGKDSGHAPSFFVFFFDAVLFTRGWQKSGYMKRLEALPYLFPHIVLAVAAYGLAMDDIGPIQHVTQLFLLVIVVDHLLGSANNRSMSRATTASRDAIQSLSLWPTVPLHVALVLLGLERAADYGVLTREFVVLTVSVGFVGAMFTIPAAHELVHRATRVERLMGLTILGLFAYPHFAIEHVGGHHRNLGTPRDPATARFGESFFAFYERAIVDSAASAWALEARRLCRLRRRVLGVHNRLLRYLAALAAAYTLIALYFGDRKS